MAAKFLRNSLRISSDIKSAHRTSISLPSHSHLTPISFTSHSHLTSISFPSRSYLVPISILLLKSLRIAHQSHFHLVPISLPSHSHLIHIHISFTSHFHLVPISFPSHFYLTSIAQVTAQSLRNRSVVAANLHYSHFSLSSFLIYLSFVLLSSLYLTSRSRQHGGKTLSTRRT
jgi:hypothetical protein